MNLQLEEGSSKNGWDYFTCSNRICT